MLELVMLNSNPVFFGGGDPIALNFLIRIRIQGLKNTDQWLKIRIHITSHNTTASQSLIFAVCSSCCNQFLMCTPAHVLLDVCRRSINTCLVYIEI